LIGIESSKQCDRRVYTGTKIHKIDDMHRIHRNSNKTNILQSITSKSEARLTMIYLRTGRHHVALLIGSKIGNDKIENK
jgi:hypothetical protein